MTRDSNNFLKNLLILKIFFGKICDPRKKFRKKNPTIFVKGAKGPQRDHQGQQRNLSRTTWNMMVSTYSGIC